MKINLWTVLGAVIIATVATNAVVNTASKIHHNRLENEEYQEELKAKKEAREAKRKAKEDAKNAAKQAGSTES